MQACARLQPRTPDDPLARRQQKSKNNEKATNSNKKSDEKGTIWRPRHVHNFAKLNQILPTKP
jgi:hypothetical protein